MKNKLLLLVVAAAISAGFANVGFAEDFDEGCAYQKPEQVEFSADFIDVRRKLRVEEDEKFRVKVFLRNTGNTPWFNGESECEGPKARLGTDNPRNHQAVFYDEDQNWEKPNRLGMDQERVDPGEIASFTFYARAGSTPDILKEYLTPVVDGTWIDSEGFSFEVIIGEPSEDMTSIRKKLLYAGESGSVLDLNLNADKKLLVDLSDQRMKVMLGDHVVREFKTSTGAYHTPTPTGEYEIKLKQDVRVGSAKPHYIMPKFMWFKDGGYGIHALPSLNFDGGQFWTEAREHIGIPVSHGCIRLLPEDADFAYEFADVGTKVVVQK